MAKNKKLPTGRSRPSISERDFLIGSFAWCVRHWTQIS
jgi:hypothetical protein